MSTPPAALPQAMSLDEVRAELRQVFGKPWTSAADGGRRQALWRRLDQLVAEQPRQPTQLLPTGPDVGPPDPDPEPSIDERPRPPDLQELVARHGGYDRIPPEAWVEHDRLMDNYHIMRRVIPRRST
jgi:hypothetical protein